MNQLFTTGQVARMMEVAPRTVAKLCDDESLPSFRIPGSQDRRIPLKSLQRFLDSIGLEYGTPDAERRVLLIREAPDPLHEAIEDALAALDIPVSFEWPRYVAAKAIGGRPVSLIVIDGAIGREATKEVIAAALARLDFAFLPLVVITPEGESWKLKAEVFRRPFDPPLFALRCERMMELQMRRVPK